MTETNHISVDKIRVDGGTQMRAVINEETVKEYTERYLAGERMPALVVFYDGSTYWLADGFHRHRALVDSATPQALCEIRRGDRRAAVLYACGANASHGLRRTNTDKRRAVEALLRDEEWRGWTDRHIANKCGVSHPFVAALREEMTGNGYQSPTERIGSDGRTTNTANIGRRPASDKPATPRAVDPEELPVVVAPAREPILAGPAPAPYREGGAPSSKPPVAPVAKPVERAFPVVNTAPTREAQEADSAALALCGFMDRATMALGEQSYHIAGFLLSEDRAGRLSISISQLKAAISELEANLGAEQ